MSVCVECRLVMLSKQYVNVTSTKCNKKWNYTFKISISLQACEISGLPDILYSLSIPVN